MEVRIVFGKKGNARFISHLDLNRLFARTLRRAKIDAKYTEGFNPHIHAVFSPPLSTGYESECEICDIRLPDDENLNSVKEKLSNALPCDIKIYKVYKAERKISEITFGLYEIKTAFPCDSVILEESKKDIITVLKKTKRGESEFDIAPFVKAINIADQNTFTCVLPVGQLTVNPSLIVNHLAKMSLNDPDFEAVRIKFYDQNMKIFE